MRMLNARHPADSSVSRLHCPACSDFVHHLGSALALQHLCHRGTSRIQQVDSQTVHYRYAQGLARGLCHRLALLSCVPQDRRLGGRLFRSLLDGVLVSAAVHADRFSRGRADLYLQPRLHGFYSDHLSDFYPTSLQQAYAAARG